MAVVVLEVKQRVKKSCSAIASIAVVKDVMLGSAKLPLNGAQIHSLPAATIIL